MSKLLSIGASVNLILRGLFLCVGISCIVGLVVIFIQGPVDVIYGVVVKLFQQKSAGMTGSDLNKLLLVRLFVGLCFRAYEVWCLAMVSILCMRLIVRTSCFSILTGTSATSKQSLILFSVGSFYYFGYWIGQLFYIAESVRKVIICLGAVYFLYLCYKYYKNRQNIEYYVEKYARNGVLFLRKFGSLSDRSLMGAVTKAAHMNRRNIVALAPGNEPFFNIDPFSMINRHAFNPFPCYLTTDDENWEHAIRKLENIVSVVVIDLSLITPSIKTELSILQERRANRGVFYLIHSKKMTSVQENDPDLLQGIDDSRLVVYDLSWWKLPVRLMISLLMMLFSSFFTYITIWYIIYRDFNYMKDPLNLISISFVVTIALYSLFVFVKPELKSSSRKNIIATIYSGTL